jgi:hypothetical protein
MRLLLIRIAAALGIAAVGPALAQVSPQPGTAYQAQRYPLAGMSPEDAYREGLINRWELERYAGPMPQALQGPSANGTKGIESGGGGGM